MSVRSRHLLMLALAALITLPCAAAAWELRLTNNAYDQQNPSISGERVVWEDYRNGNSDIYLYDGATGQTRRLTDLPSDQVRPQIAGRHVVWEDYRNSGSQKNNPDIYLLDLETGAEMMVNSPQPIFGGYECTPAIDNTDGVVVVTWIEKASGISEQGRVFYRYIDGSSLPRQADQQLNAEKEPWVSAQKIVWTDEVLCGVYFRYIISANTETYTLERIPDEPITHLRIDGNRIVWSQYRADRGVWNVRFCELDLTLTNGTKRWLSEVNRFQTDPVVDGNIVVWSDERNGDPDLFLYDLGAHQERPFATAAGQQFQSAIDGGIVAFTDTRNGNEEIYLASVTDAIPIPGIKPVPGGVDVPRDLDGDGLYEDVNGNKAKDFNDIILYFQQMQWIAQNEATLQFDYNANGGVDFADIIWLFNHL